MSGPTLSRSQRRLEKRQAIILLLVILAVALTSFVLGVMVGRQGTPALTAGPEAASLRFPAAEPPAAPKAEAQPAPGSPEPEKLSFYETLPRGETQPLGSGINLPSRPVVAPTKEPKSIHPSQEPSSTASPPVEGDRPPKPNQSGDYLVQAASFRQLEAAQDFREKLAAKEFPVFVEKVDLGPKGTWYRVLAGPYASEEARRAASRLKDEFRITAIVKKR